MIQMGIDLAATTSRTVTTIDLAMEKIMAIRQEGTIKNYCEEFESLFNQVINFEEISEFYAIYLFMDGLEPRIRDIFITWHQYSCHTVKDVISLALKIDANELQDSFSPFDPKSSFYIMALVFDFRKSVDEIMEGNESFKDGKIQEISNKDRMFDKSAYKEFVVNGSGENGRVTDNDVLRGNGNDNRTAPKMFDEMPEDIMNTTKSDFKESVNGNDDDVKESESEIKTIDINDIIGIIAEDSKENTTYVETNKDKKLECLDVLDEVESLVDSDDLNRIDHEITEKESVLIGMVQEKVNDVGTVLIKDRKEWQFSINLIVVESFEWKPGGQLCLVENLKKKQHHVKDFVQNDNRVRDNIYLRCYVMNSVVSGTFGSSLKAQVLQSVTTYDQLVPWIAKSLVKQGLEKCILNKLSDEPKKINVLINQIVGILVLVARKLEGNSDRSAQHRLESTTSEENIFPKVRHKAEKQLKQLMGVINNKVKISCNDDTSNQVVRMESEVADQEINKEEYIPALPTAVVNQEKTEIKSKIACGRVHMSFWLNHRVICWTDTGWALSAQVISKRSLFLPKERKQINQTSLQVVEETVDLTVKALSIPIVAQEYGCGSVLIQGNIVVFLNYKDRRLYKQVTDSKDSAPGPLSLDYGGYVDGFYRTSTNRFIVVSENRGEVTSNTIAISQLIIKALVVAINFILQLDVENQNVDLAKLLEYEDDVTFGWKPGWQCVRFVTAMFRNHKLEFVGEVSFHGIVVRIFGWKASWQRVSFVTTISQARTTLKMLRANQTHVVVFSDRNLKRHYDPNLEEVLLDGVNFNRLKLKWPRHQIGLMKGYECKAIFSKVSTLFVMFCEIHITIDGIGLKVSEVTTDMYILFRTLEDQLEDDEDIHRNGAIKNLVDLIQLSFHVLEHNDIFFFRLLADFDENQSRAMDSKEAFQRVCRFGV